MVFFSTNCFHDQVFRLMKFARTVRILLHQSKLRSYLVEREIERENLYPKIHLIDFLPLLDFREIYCYCSEYISNLSVPLIGICYSIDIPTLFRFDERDCQSKKQSFSILNSNLCKDFETERRLRKGSKNQRIHPDSF